jgi:hypothetical protein
MKISEQVAGGPGSLRRRLGKQVIRHRRALDQVHDQLGSADQMYCGHRVAVSAGVGHHKRLGFEATTGSVSSDDRAVADIEDVAVPASGDQSHPRRAWSWVTAVRPLR